MSHEEEVLARLVGRWEESEMGLQRKIGLGSSIFATWLGKQERLCLEEKG